MKIGKGTIIEVPKGKVSVYLKQGLQFEITEARHYPDGSVYFDAVGKIVLTNELTETVINGKIKRCYHLNGKDWIVKRKKTKL